MIGEKFIPVFQGETRVSGREGEVLTTILGSCIATCIWDPIVGVGGINHFLLPGQDSDRGKNLRYGVNAMELLINGLIKQGAQRERLKSKILGGAKMIDGGSEIGIKNANFANWYMENEGIEVVSRCLGGERGRKIRFWAVTGRLQRIFLGTADTVPLDIDYSPTSRSAPKAPSKPFDAQLF